MTRMRSLRGCLILAFLLATLACATPAHADWIISDTQSYTYPEALPSFDGDIIVEATGDLSLTGYDLTLPGSMYVYGHLTLNNCTLRFSPSSHGEKGMRSFGRLDASDSFFASTSGQPVGIEAWGTSENHFTRCTVDPVWAEFAGSSTNFLTSCSLLGTPYDQIIHFCGTSTTITDDGDPATDDSRLWAVTRFDGGTATVTRTSFKGIGGNHSTQGTADTTLVGCRLPIGFEFHTPSRTTLRDCDFTDGGPQIRVHSGALVHLQDLVPAPGEYVTYPLIEDPGSGYRLEIINSLVPAFVLVPQQRGQLLVERCQIANLECSEYSQTDFVGGSVDVIQVMTRGGWGVYDPTVQPDSLIARDLYDDGRPLTTLYDGEGMVISQGIGSPNTPFRVTFDDTSVPGTITFWLGSSATWQPSSSLIENSNICAVLASENVQVTVRNSILGGGGLTAEEPDDYAQFIAEGSHIDDLVLQGDHTRAALGPSVLGQQSSVGYAIRFCNDYFRRAARTPYSSPELFLDGATFGTSGGIAVYPNVVGACITSTTAATTFGPSWHVVPLPPDSTLLRQFPVLVQNDLALPVPGAAVWVTDAAGEVLWEGVTDAEGYAYPEITFDQYNYDTEFRVKAWYPGWYASGPVRFLSSTPLVLSLTGNTLAFTSFEQERYPWAAFAAGAGSGAMWRALGATGDLPPAHSGDYLMSAEVSDEAVTALRLDLPAEPTGPIPSDYTLRTWLYPDAATANTSTLVGFVLADACVTPTSAPSSVGWEVMSPTTSRLWVGETATPLAFGLSLDRWHLVQLKYDRVAQTATLWVNGVLVREADASALAGQPARHVALGAFSAAGGAARTCFDDTSLTLGWPPDAPAPGIVTHPYALLEGPERMISGQEEAYTLTYGNGYPVLGMGSFPSPAGQKLYVGLSLPADYTLVSATPAPSRIVANTPVWELDPPAMGNEGEIALTWQSPAGLLSERADRVAAWATADPGGASTDPANPPNWPSPCDDPVWACLQDLLPQRVMIEENLLPDLWVRKTGPETASPGDALGYLITAGNSGFATAENVVVKDRLPVEMGGGTSIVANLATLAPGDKWRGLHTAALSWGVPGGTLLLNRAFVPTSTPELAYDNNTAEWTTTVQAARDPNQITVSPTGGADRGQTLTYTLECENIGLGTAYGVYASAELDEKLDEGTLSLPDGVLYDPGSRMLLWEVGTLGAGEGASTSFTITVAGTAKRARPVIGQATVYFPSVPEETPTNVVFNVVAGTFPDVPWDHWAVLPIELAYENGIVGGYPGGAYQPATSVDRGQMAVFIARALADGDSNVPTGPATPTFPDVLTDHWAYRYIEYAKAQGVVGGYPDGSYRSDELLDRGQMAVFIARALAGGDSAVPPAPPTPTFPDVGPATTWAWAHKHVEYTVSRGVVAGYPDGYYHPELGCTRDQMAVFVARAFELPM